MSEAKITHGYHTNHSTIELGPQITSNKGLPEGLPEAENIITEEH